jgi:hypothetical protein
MLKSQIARAREERGAVTVLFALFLPLLMIFGSLVISVGSWYTHARQLQTKVDAAAFAGGGVWSFPCAPDADVRIRDTARKYVGDHMADDGTAGGTPITGSYNPMIGGVEGDQIFVTLNQAQWWDDSFPGTDFTNPAGSVCEAKTLDVKATEKDSPLLWGWLPYRPDIKKRARVELEHAPSLNRLLPIAVRVPRPMSSAAVFYDEANGNVLAVRYLKAKSGIDGLPAGLEGYSTFDEDDAGSWATISSLPSTTGVALALSFRPACGTSGTVPPCFEDEGFTSVNSLCNQGSGTQIVECYYAKGDWPNQTVYDAVPANRGSGLHFIRGHPTESVGGGPPQLRDAYLENASCVSNGYFNSFPTGSCQAKLTVAVDLGSVVESTCIVDLVCDLIGDDDTEQTRKAGNVEVRYRLVRADGSTFCNNYGASCDLEIASGNGEQQGVVTYTTQGTGSSLHPLLEAASTGNSIAIQIRVRRSSVNPNPGNCGPNLSNFNNNCRWFHVGSGIFGTSVEPTATAILASPVQRAFMGAVDLSGPVSWLRLVQDADWNGNGECDETNNILDGPAASHPASAPACFYLDMGLRGGIARDQDEPPFAFNEGTGPSQMGFVDCDPAIPQGQVLEDGVIKGCEPFYAPNQFSSNPLCPDQNQFFTVPKPAPFDDWPPYDCIKTRPSGAGNQLMAGLNERIFHDKTNPQCPDDDGRYVEGRNYWHRSNNPMYTAINYAWDNDTPALEADDLTNRIRADDPRLVTLFFTPYDSFSGSGQETFPIVALGSFYVTGYGRLNGSGGWQGGAPEDPCTGGNNTDPYDGTGNEPPPDLNMNGGPAGGSVVWGHFLKLVVPASSSTGGGTGDPCDTAPSSFQPCVSVLVE